MDPATTVRHRIPFKAVGNLPAPDGLPKPTKFVPMFHRNVGCEYGSVRVMDEDHSDRKTNYSFTPMNPQGSFGHRHGWQLFVTDWNASQCPVYRDKKCRYLWDIFIAHDDTQHRE